MKIRSGFVSNSSSSSYIVIGKAPTECRYIRLNSRQAHTIVEYIENNKENPCDIPWSADQDIYLTEFLSDAGDLCFEIPKKYNAYVYCWGGHTGPYSEEYFDVLAESEYNGYFHPDVWILKEHNLEE